MGGAHAFIPPTALRLLKSVERPRDPSASSCAPSVRAGEASGGKTFEWARAALGVEVSEFYGQTECNIVISSATDLGVASPAPWARRHRGHQVAIIDGEGRVLPPGAVGQWRSGVPIR